MTTPSLPAGELHKHRLRARPDVGSHRLEQDPTTRGTMSGTRIGLVRCEHCGRQFNPHSGARHIPWCAKQQSDSRRHKLSAEKRQALERYKWRISYKPSNRFYQQPANHSEAPNNCSNLSSSLSASSSASIGSNSLEGSRARQQAAAVAGRKRPMQSVTEAGRLKRSISSLTMTKQSGAAEPRRQLDQFSLSSTESARVRAAKSHSDLQQRDVTDVVESLARRVDEIYAQNQLLLANLSLSAQPDAGRAETEGREDEPVRCHHCKSGCLRTANYCHRCGCKLSSSPG